MSFKCKIGLHSWDGCKCSDCGLTREDHHNWKNDCNTCSECGKTRDDEHGWSLDCEKCWVCGITRENHHDWTKSCEQCSKCGKTRENHHDWSKDCEKCSKCGISRKNGHTWNGCKCSKCGIKRNQGHNWNISFKCTKCGTNAPRSVIDAALVDAINSGSQELVKIALDAGAEINRDIEVYPKRGSYDHLEIGSLLEGIPIIKNPLKIAIENDKVEIVRFLLKKGAILKIEKVNNPWNAILLDAATNNQPEIALLALEKGANINSRGLHHTNPLILASMFGHVQMVKFLITNGADLTSWSTDPYNPSRKGRTALMWARSEDHKEVTKILLDAGAIE